MTEQTRWQALTGGTTGADYAARITAFAASGADPHGEARFCTELVPAPARVLDAGCGTGRIAIRLAELGYDCVGIDLDASMLAEARAAAPELAWHEADLATYVPDGPPFDLVVAAGNVIPLLGPGSLENTVRRLATALVPAGLLVAGFGLDRAHLPRGCPPTPLADYDAAAAAAGLSPLLRYATWDGAEYPGDGGYVVRVHRR